MLKMKNVIKSRAWCTHHSAAMRMLARMKQMMHGNSQGCDHQQVGVGHNHTHYYISATIALLCNVILNYSVSNCGDTDSIIHNDFVHHL